MNGFLLMKSRLTVTNMCNYVVSVCFCVFWVLSASCLLYEGDVCVSKSDGRQGQCVDVRRCRSALDDIKSKKHPQLCSFNRTHPIICCTDSELVDITSTTLVSENKPGQKARENCLKYLTGPHYGCTIIRTPMEISPPSQPDPRVRDAIPNEFPHMALLGYGLEWNSAEWLCGGSVISDRFVITSAYCAQNHKVSVRFVALGVLKRSEIPLTRKEQRYEVKNIVYHPYYEFLVKYFDIALLEVSPSIQFNSISIKPACLVLDSSADTADALSWGSLGHSQGVSQGFVNTLQVMNFNKFSTEVCDDAYPSYRNFKEGFDSETQDCFGDKNNISYTCSIDSGGPLQVRLQIAKDSTSKPCGVEIISLISFGSPCPRGPFSSAGVFTKIPYYVPWIESIVWP